MLWSQGPHFENHSSIILVLVSLTKKIQESSVTCSGYLEICIFFFSAFIYFILGWSNSVWGSDIFWQRPVPSQVQDSVGMGCRHPMQGTPLNASWVQTLAGDFLRELTGPFHDILMWLAWTGNRSQFFPKRVNLHYLELTFFHWKCIRYIVSKSLIQL